MSAQVHFCAFLGDENSFVVREAAFMPAFVCSHAKCTKVFIGRLHCESRQLFLLEVLVHKDSHLYPHHYQWSASVVTPDL